MTDLVNQRRGHAAADHALARHANDRHGIVPSAGEPRPRPADRGPRSAREIADDGRGLEVSWQRQRVAGNDVEPGEPESGIRLAALAQRLAEDVHVRQPPVELESEEGEAALR